MVATSRHHGMPALPDSKDGLQGALFNLWTHDAKHRQQQPNTTHLDPPPPARRPGHCSGFVQLGLPQRGPGVVGAEGGGWEGGVFGGVCCLGPVRRRPRGGPNRPPPLPLPPHLPLPLRPGHRPRGHGGCRAQRALFCGGRAPNRDLQGGQRRCGVGDPLRHLGRCPPGAADHIVAPPQHRPSVAAAQVLEGWGMVNHVSM